MKQKRYFLIALALLVLMIFSITACGSTEQTNGTAEPEEPAEATEATFPTKPITIIVPYNPGGGVDTSTRTIQSALQEAFGQQIVVENRPGGGMSIGYNYVATADPDGYTILAAPIPTMVFTDLTLPDLTANFSDFKPVASWINDDCAPLVVRSDSPYESTTEFIEAAKAGTLKLGLSGGAYSTDHMTYALLADQTGATFNLVPYDSSGDALAALEGGHVDGVLASLVTAITAQEAGNARILGVSSGRRVSVAPDVPSFKEEGIDVVVEFHIGLFAPPGTPDDIVKILSEKVLEAATSEEFRKRVEEVKSPAGEPMDMEAWAKYCDDEYNRWSKGMDVLERHPLG